MPILLIFALTAACVRIHWPAPVLGGGLETPAVFTATTLCLSIFSALALRSWVVTSLHRSPSRRIEVGLVYSRFRRRLFFVNLGVAAGCVLLFGWGWFTQQLLVLEWDGRPILAPFAELAVPLPYFILLVSAWLIYYDAEKVLHQTTIFGPASRSFWSRPGYFLNHLRQFLLMVMMPVLLFVCQQTMIEFFPQYVETDWYRIGSMLVLFLVFLLLPLAVRPLLGLRSMPAGSIRDRLEALAKRLNFRYVDFLLWPTHGAAANAMIVGLVRRVRYVVFTDRLLDDMPPEELEAVFGHEVGHARHGHIWYYALFFVLSVFTLAAGLVYLDKVLDAEGIELPNWVGDWVSLCPLALAVGYLFVVWGFLSRRCERQADVYGCRSVSCSDPACKGHNEATVYPENAAGLCPTGIRTFIAALERVDLVNGMSGTEEERPGSLRGIVHELMKWLKAWQHSTIPRRVAFLQSLIEDPGKERAFQRSIVAIRWGLVLGLAAALLVLGQAVGWRDLYRAI